MSTHKNVGSTEARLREAQRLSTLLDVSQALAGLDLKASLHRVLEILAAQYGAVRGLVSLVDADGDLRLVAADGTGDASRAVRYRMGEGITGRAVQSGKPIVVPRVSREPAFLHRAARRPELARQELSFICVPIMLSRRAVGALAIDVKFDPERLQPQRQVPRHRRVDDRAGGEDPPADRGGQAPPGRRERAPAPGTARAL